MTIEGIHYAGIEARLEREQGSNVWLTMGLREGKNREIKRVLEHLGLSVNRLIRVSFGPFELGDLAEGEVEEVRTRVLRDQLGAEAGAARRASISTARSSIARPAAPPPALSAANPARRRGASSARSRRPRGARRGAAREPEPSQPPRKRKHVSALRAEIEADAQGPRKRIERSATSDRKGATIEVERIVATPEERAGARAETARAAIARASEAERRGGERPRERPRSCARGEPATSARRASASRFDKSALASGAERPPRGRRPSAAAARAGLARAPALGAKSGATSRGKPGG